MKSNLQLKIFAIVLLIPLVALIFGGCAAKSSEESSQSSQTGSASSEAVISSEISEASSAPAESAPTGEPTFLIGLDGKAILTSEITRLENTDKTAETLTADDLYADVYCEGFAYCKISSGMGYDSYNNPELFNGYKFIGEMPENKNEWVRVYVGDEICGLKVKSAQTHFIVNDWDDYKTPERYYNANGSYIEWEGTIEAEGFLQVNNNSVMYPETNEWIWFYPVSIDYPLMAWLSRINDEKVYDRPFGVNGLYNHHDDFLYLSEFEYFTLGSLGEVDCDMDGLGTGDIAYARVKISFGGDGATTLDEVELLSDILAHDEDETEARQPAPVL